jgi:hypothetical protein
VLYDPADNPRFAHLVANQDIRWRILIPPKDDL